MVVRSRADVEAMLAQRIAEDPAFRARLEEDPRAAVGEVLGIAIPEAVTVTIHAESLTDVHLTVPAASGQLSDADLDLAAGGGAWLDPADRITTRGY